MLARGLTLLVCCGVAAAASYEVSIEHGPRRVIVSSDGSRVHEVVCGEESLFQAIHQGMNAVKEHAKIGGNNFGSDEFRDALVREQVTVDVTGDKREAAVARWYVVGELVGDRAGSDADLPAIRAVPRVTDESIYDNFNFGVDSSEIDALRTYFEQYNVVVQGLPSFKDAIAGLSTVEVFEKRPLRIGVLGVTGAGKSTFVTAILGRAVLSRSNEICTGAITEIEHVGETGRGEHFIVTFLDKEEKDYFQAEDAKKLKALEDKFSAECPGGAGAEGEPCAHLKDRLDEQKLATQQMQAAIAKWQPAPLIVVRTTRMISINLPPSIIQL